MDVFVAGVIFIDVAALGFKFNVAERFIGIINKLLFTGDPYRVKTVVNQLPDSRREIKLPQVVGKLARVLRQVVQIPGVKFDFFCFNRVEIIHLVRAPRKTVRADQ